METGVKMSQKEYLRKYLSGKDDGARKKKKKKQKIGTKTVTIIDDDLDVKNMRPIEDGEFEIFNRTEEAPQIVGVVDERGPVDFADKRRWRIIADDGDGNVACSANENRDATEDPELSTGNDSVRSRKLRNSSDSDLSPPRVSNRKESNLEPPDEDSRRKASRKKRGKEAYASSSDSSSHRKKTKRHKKEKNKSVERSAKITYDSDLSPPRNTKKRQDVDSSRQNTRLNRDDSSPPRRSRNDEKMFASVGVSSRSKSIRSRGSDSDLSPPRASRKTSGRGDDSRQKRRVEKESGRPGKSRGRSRSPRRSRWNENERSPPRVHGRTDHQRMKKTLDGKTAGLQDARALRIETEAHKKREAQLFKQMSAEVSGVGQAAVLRDRRTGRKRDLTAEAAERREKEKRQEEINEKYAKWGKGLKQVGDQAEKRERDLYEMSKPLARYANDPDLDRELRQVERDGDTMLAEIKNRQIVQRKRQPELPSYQGSFLPNRFGIKPGHRWDGVDRSNGYEKKWFDARNARTALEEEAYKWSTADM